jgi:hypothetical protein
MDPPNTGPQSPDKLSPTCSPQGCVLQVAALSLWLLETFQKVREFWPEGSVRTPVQSRTRGGDQVAPLGDESLDPEP